MKRPAPSTSPCFGCASTRAARSACPGCGLVLCQPCAEAPDLLGYAACCDIPPVSEDERHVMEHATGWESRRPLYRNHYCASEGHDMWPALQSLIGKGFMYESRKPSELSGGDHVISVTKEGVAWLRHASPLTRAQKKAEARS